MYIFIQAQNPAPRLSPHLAFLVVQKVEKTCEDDKLIAHHELVVVPGWH